MSALLDLQRRVAKVVMQPLTGSDRMRRRSESGGSITAESRALIKPNSMLSSFERLEIYNRQYWFRVLSSFGEDFPGLRAIVGARRFDGLMRKYLAECPSQSFTLRNLGSRLEKWLGRNLDLTGANAALALDMVRLEWAHIEAFDSGFEPPLTPADIEMSGLDGELFMQAYIRLLELDYAVDDLLIEIHSFADESGTSSNSARVQQTERRVRHYRKPERERIHLVVHRADDSVYYKRVEAEAFRMLSALKGKNSFEASVEAAFEDSSMPEEERMTALQNWFANWAELGWFCRPTKHCDA